jgi:phospholipase C
LSLYDHQMSPILNQSQTSLDALTGAGLCGSNTARVPNGQQARCGLGPRQPLLVVSPFARSNAVDHSLTDQSSVVRFIENNWKPAGQLTADISPVAPPPKPMGFAGTPG